MSDDNKRRPNLKIVQLKHEQDESPEDVLSDFLGQADEIVEVFIVARMKKKPGDETMAFMFDWSKPMDFADLMRLIEMGRIHSMLEFAPMTYGEDDDE